VFSSGSVVGTTDGAKSMKRDSYSPSEVDEATMVPLGKAARQQPAASTDKVETKAGSILVPPDVPAHRSRR